MKRLPCISGTFSIPDISMAYCSQMPWLCNETIRDTIVGQKEYDEAWYKKAISVCALEHDLEAIQDGDQSVVGSHGTTLSGGQKQRLVSIPPSRGPTIREHVSHLKLSEILFLKRIYTDNP